MGDTSKDEPICFRLYIAGGAPNSTIALNNLRAIIDNYLSDGRYKLDIVDVLKEPLRAIDDGVLLTPTLVKLSPPPSIKITGNLCKMDKVVKILGLGGSSQ